MPTARKKNPLGNIRLIGGPRNLERTPMDHLGAEVLFNRWLKKRNRKILVTDIYRYEQLGDGELVALYRGMQEAT